MIWLSLGIHARSETPGNWASDSVGFLMFLLLCPDYADDLGSFTEVISTVYVDPLFLSTYVTTPPLFALHQSFIRWRQWHIVFGECWTRPMYQFSVSQCLQHHSHLSSPSSAIFYTSAIRVPIISFCMKIFNNVTPVSRQIIFMVLFASLPPPVSEVRT